MFLRNWNIYIIIYNNVFIKFSKFTRFIKYNVAKN